MYLVPPRVMKRSRGWRGPDDFPPRRIAARWLEKAADYRASFMLPIKVYPFFDPIREDPRFTALLEKHGLA